MATFFKYLFLFVVFGIIWFLIFSIQISKNSNIFLVLQKEFRMTVDDDDDSGGNKKPIDRQKVIDAISKAFNE